MCYKENLEKIPGYCYPFNRYIEKWQFNIIINMGRKRKGSND
jgi:hypothetical protein